MSKTVVCIIDEEEIILNYLFIKEMFESGDTTLLISPLRLSKQIDRYIDLLPEIDTFKTIILEREGDEELWDKIYRYINTRLSPSELYYVNLSSGTRLISIAVQQAFERFNSKFFFMPQDKNIIIHSQIDGSANYSADIICEINHKVTVSEYLNINGIESSCRGITQSIEYTSYIYSLFMDRAFTAYDWDIIEQLREHRNGYVNIDGVEGLRDFLNRIYFPLQQNNKLLPHEIQYITGNWFEEYIYTLIKSIVTPNDIAISVEIKRIGSHNTNELDVVFTYNNKLYAIECKTGVGRVSIFNQIVYKACALKEALLGVRSNAYIISLNDVNDSYMFKTAKNMGITFCDRGYVNNHKRLLKLLV